jgi:hypothetical protein
MLICDVAADMIGDLKTTHLFGASPKAVPCGQLTGAIVSIFMAAGVYVVFSTAYPCINDLSYTTCSFPTPDVLSWRAGSYSSNCALHATDQFNRQLRLQSHRRPFPSHRHQGHGIQ